MKQVTYIIFLLLIVLLSFTSCTDDKNNAVNDFFYLKNDGANLPIFVEGNNSTNTFMVVLHGGPGGDGQIYNTGIPYFSDLMENNFVMVYYDQRGSGTSSGHFSSDDLTVDQHVEDLEKLLVLLRYKYGSDINIFLMGHSWGGTLGSAFLLKDNNQDQINGWIEVDGAHDFKGTDELIRNFQTVGNEQIIKGNDEKFWEEVIDYCDGVTPGSETDEEISKLNSYSYDAEQKLADAGEIEFQGDITFIENLGATLNYKLFSAYNPLTMKINGMVTSITMFDEIVDIDYTSQLYTITIPALLIWGELDMVVPNELGQQAYDNLGTPVADKQFIIVNNTGHSPMIYDPDGFVSIVSNFVNNHISK
jgi:pimeloyl-ACP methyl ester carboxylesterase